ncbi:SGNH/GDSL hydrolase family protein [Curtobacterium sp. MCPF17_021]|uniref:SGNH/GDSL hydrolase family protein n=1 Tax=Curtobacterium sp. MCPF17_021 TaxID=2175639 RepID=UPI0015E8B1F9|nr:SGNH/GDSL hydrolase family protein [Curtobacterium sp. MCPF17_021]WIE82396.1 SGNH/GDSL hydrolase family protein [Curtobacterium sp. MCPF17_021]
MHHAPRLRRTNALLITSGVLTAAALAVGAAGPVSAANADGATPTGSVAAVASSPGGTDYVALGDSYAGGFGVAPYGSGPAAGCFQSTTDYPHQVAASLGLQLNDRACAGATTGNISRVPQATGVGRATAPVQADALSKDTDIVTVSIGGNDLGFTGVIKNCIALDKNGPVFSEIRGHSYDRCKDYYAPVVRGVVHDRLAARIRNTVAPRLAQTFRVIAQRAPQAKVFVVGYPMIAPSSAQFPKGCFSSLIGDSGLEPPFPQNAFPFTTADTAYFHRTQNALDGAVKAAAKARGFTFVPALQGSAAHTACAASGSAWMAGLTLTDRGTAADSTPVAGTKLSILFGALHPNAAGVAYLRDQTKAAIVRSR